MEPVTVIANWLSGVPRRQPEEDAPPETEKVAVQGPPYRETWEERPKRTEPRAENTPPVCEEGRRVRIVARWTLLTLAIGLAVWAVGSVFFGLEQVVVHKDIITDGEPHVSYPLLDVLIVSGTVGALAALLTVGGLLRRTLSVVGEFLYPTTVDRWVDRLVKNPMPTSAFRQQPDMGDTALWSLSLLACLGTLGIGVFTPLGAYTGMLASFTLASIAVLLLVIVRMAWKVCLYVMLGAVLGSIIGLIAVTMACEKYVPRAARTVGRGVARTARTAVRVLFTD